MTPRASDGITGFVELWLPARPPYVRLARALLRTTAMHNGFSEHQAADMAVAVSEAYTNVILHAKTSWVTIRYAVDPYAMTIEVEDDGEGFDLAILDQPYVPASQVGRGVHLIRNLMDTVECQSSPMGTVVRMTKEKEPPPGGALPWKIIGRPFRTTGHIRRTIDRYQRDLALMRGEAEPIDDDLDDLAILERFEAAEDRETLINDRKLRIKTLQATLEILREDIEHDPSHS